MKCNQDLFETLFQTAQKPLVMECSQALEAIRFSLPIDWTVQQQSESLLYLLPSEGESSLSVQSVVPESTDVMEFEKFGRGKNLRVAKVTMDKLPSLMIPQANAYVINPLGFNLILNKEQVEKIAGISK